jgi:DNA-binding transcriptional ArsR family regulator
LSRQEGGGDEIDQRLIRALGHPLRVEILRVLGERSGSPMALSKILGQPLGNVSYHVSVLAENDCIELIETRPARGAVEHIYRAKSHASLGSRSWQNVPSALREDVAGASLDAFTTRAIAALEGGAFQEREGSGLTWFPLTVDEQGWKEIRRVLDGVESRFRAIADKSANRLDDPAEGIPLIVAVAAFEARDGGDRPTK